MNTHIDRYTFSSSNSAYLIKKFYTTIHGTAFTDSSVFVCRYRVVAGYYDGCSYFSAASAVGYMYWRTQSGSIASDYTLFANPAGGVGVGMYPSSGYMQVQFMTVGLYSANNMVAWCDLFVTGP